jgi:hypothetical protein
MTGPEANHWMQATPGYARCLFLSQRPGAPDPGRSAIHSAGGLSPAWPWFGRSLDSIPAPSRHTRGRCGISPVAGRCRVPNQSVQATAS